MLSQSRTAPNANKSYIGIMQLRATPLTSFECFICLNTNAWRILNPFHLLQHPNTRMICKHISIYMYEHVIKWTNHQISLRTNKFSNTLLTSNNLFFKKYSSVRICQVFFEVVTLKKTNRVTGRQQFSTTTAVEEV